MEFMEKFGKKGFLKIIEKNLFGAIKLVKKKYEKYEYY
jgi:hypothetical protein